MYEMDVSKTVSETVHTKLADRESKYSWILRNVWPQHIGSYSMAETARKKDLIYQRFCDLKCSLVMLANVDWLYFDKSLDWSEVRSSKLTLNSQVFTSI